MAAGFDSGGGSSLFSDLPGPPKQAVVCLCVCVRDLFEEENSLDLRHKQSVASFFLGCDQKYQLWDSFDGCDQIHVAGADVEMQIETTRLGFLLFPLHIIKKKISPRIIMFSFF